jgi:hypothetical protein
MYILIDVYFVFFLSKLSMNIIFVSTSDRNMEIGKYQGTMKGLNSLWTYRIFFEP